MSIRDVRSRVHMLTVAAARLEREHANPKLIADLRHAATDAAKLVAEGRYQPSDETRIERQRTLMQMLPDTRAVDQLKAAMLQRCYDLMWDGDTSACDALVEFLPECDVTRMFDAWEADQMPGDHPRSEFYEGKAA